MYVPRINSYNMSIYVPANYIVICLMGLVFIVQNWSNLKLKPIVLYFNSYSRKEHFY